jgi:transglutaminase-like putative cysteine protease
MRLKIRHTSIQVYDEPAQSLVQALRLTPRPYEGLRILRWNVSGQGGRALAASVDGFGNIVHSQALHRAHEVASVTVEGEVETLDVYGVTRASYETLPPSFYLSEVLETKADKAIAALADAVAAGRSNELDILHRLTHAVRDKLALEAGEPELSSTAALALAAGKGTASDLSHVLIAAARTLGHPGRIVTGYLWSGDDVVAPASHAWAEVHVGHLGWVGFDCANRVSPTDAYVRVAVGRCWGDAAPVRGIRRGGKLEQQRTAIEVQSGLSAQQQQQQ